MNGETNISEFTDASIVVTGGVNGIGQAIVSRFVALGARIFVLDRDKYREDFHHFNRIPDQITLIPTDLSKHVEIEAALDVIKNHTNKIDVLVSNAGVSHNSLIEETTPEDWSRVIDVNLSAAFHCLRLCLPLLKRAPNASVVNIASIAGKRISFSAGAAYTASKSGLLGLTRHAAYELARYGVRVNAICPGPTMTPMIEQALTEEQRDLERRNFPLGEWIPPVKIAEAVQFLASKSASMCTGTALDVDAGVLISNGQPISR